MRPDRFMELCRYLRLVRKQTEAKKPLMPRAADGSPASISLL